MMTSFRTVVGLLLALTLFGFSACTPTFAGDGSPRIYLTPEAASLAVGGTVAVSVMVDTGGSAARAAIVDIRFDHAVLEVAGGVEGVTEPASPAFDLLTPAITDGHLSFSILEASFTEISYSGSVAEFQFRALTTSIGSSVTLTGDTAFVPEISGTSLQGASYTVLAAPPTPTSTPGAATPTVTVTPTAEAPTPTNTSAVTPAASATPTPGCDSGYYVLDSNRI
jgi:hypothetical protein